MAGEDPFGVFTADSFRADIRQTMFMALPDDTTLRPVFLFPDERTVTNPDVDGEPWDWDQTPQGPEPGRVTCGLGTGQVVCVWEPLGETRRPITVALGDFEPDRLVITVLDVDWALIDGFNVVAFPRGRYRYEKRIPDRGLFDVTVYQVHVIAEDVA